MLTRALFNGMDEATVRKDVLIPLLQAMGYRDVHEYHGVGELGKDIVCWKPDDLGVRENLAIVAKATPMSGRANPNAGTAGEVQTQIRQCFGSHYNDPRNSSEQHIDKVWVVSNKRISREAIEAVKSAVASEVLMRHVRFAEGDKVWELVEKHLFAKPVETDRPILTVSFPDGAERIEKERASEIINREYKRVHNSGTMAYDTMRMPTRVKLYLQNTGGATADDIEIAISSLPEFPLSFGFEGIAGKDTSRVSHDSLDLQLKGPIHPDETRRVYLTDVYIETPEKNREYSISWRAQCRGMAKASTGVIKLFVPLSSV